MDFPYGKAPLAILVLAILSAGAVLWSRQRQEASRPDLIFATFSKEQGAAYSEALPAFEKKYHCRVQIQVVDQRALQNRLQSAMQVGAEVPDMAELLDGTMGFFTKGPIEDVGFVDLTKIMHTSGLYDRIVKSRFTKWSSRGHIFAIPHDVHPLMLCYRRDLVEKFGIDVNKLTTWDEFCRVGRQVVKDSTGPDGVVQHYMLDLPSDGFDCLRFLILQHGGSIFNDNGQVCFDSPGNADVICWYVRQLEGKDKIGFPCGWGQPLSRAMIDGLCLFYFCPDWRTEQFQSDVPSLSGKLDLMPLPAWKPGGLRTSTWGGTGLAITKQCQDRGKFDLAWKLAMYLYLDPQQLGERFDTTHVLPPEKDLWKLPVFDQRSPFFCNIKLARVYANLAPSIPQEVVSPYQQQAVGKLSSAFLDAMAYYADHGDAGLHAYVTADLKKNADYVRHVMARNVFLAKSDAEDPQ
ncbi:MAG TPA: extracellular solute-binding protein [Tepidisphaeraceae bacterium]|nr:extracellular solute-binding protein [Tepidisphaeraceae bacterium]